MTEEVLFETFIKSLIEKLDDFQCYPFHLYMMSLLTQLDIDPQYVSAHSTKFHSGEKKIQKLVSQTTSTHSSIEAYVLKNS